MVNKIALILIFLFSTSQALAENIEKNTAKMQAMDKITGRVSVIEVPVNGEVKFGSLSIVLRACQTRPAEEAPDNFAFVDITDKTLQNEEINIFKGWMISSSPATHAVEHPIYDVWLLQCHDTQIDKTLLLSEKQLKIRDNIPMQKVSAKSAKNITKEQASINLDQPMDEIKAENTDAENNPPQMPTEFSYDEDEEIIEEDVPADEENPSTASPLPENLSLIPEQAEY